MNTIATLLRDRVTQVLMRLFHPLLPVEECIADVVPTREEEFGHYQCSHALKLAKALKRNPKEIAQQILDGLDAETYRMLESAQIAGAGFINFTLSASFLSQEIARRLLDPLLGVPAPNVRQKIIVEFSSPNVAKELHVGHLRSTIIGDCLARLFEFLGHEVLRLNHIGDWGTQFGMLIAYLKETEQADNMDLAALMHSYREAKKRFDADPAFKQRAQYEVVRLQANDPHSLQHWHKICDASRRGFQEIYDLLDVQLIERGESFYNAELPAVVAELEQKGLITLSEGAKCLFLEGFSLPLMVQKADGGYNYDTTDLAAIRHRTLIERANRVIVVVDSGQSLHMQLIFRAAEKAGWMGTTRTDHVGFGLVLGADGKKFKTRSGDTEKLIDLLHEAIDTARRLLIEHGTAPSEAETLAPIIGIDAVKYADLSSHRLKDYTFSYERMLRFEGNTALFLLYSYVRILGIQRKVGIDLTHATPQLCLAHPSEISLGFHLCRFGEVILLLAEDLLPHRLAEYLYLLAEKFNAFFRDCRVEGSADETSRLWLTEMTRRIFQRGLEILGLQVIERL